MISDPWALVRTLAAYAVSAAVALGFGYLLGKTNAEKAALVTAKEASDQHAIELGKANMRTRVREQAHGTEIESLRTDFAAQVAAARGDADRKRARLADGSDRMRLPVVACSSPSVVPGAAGPAVGADEAPTAELEPAVATALHDLTVDGDEAIRELTALQEWSRRAVKLCNGAPP